MSTPALKVLLKSPFSQFSGYGHDGFELLRALRNWGADVYPQPVWVDVPVPPDLLPLFGKTLQGPFDLTINHWDPPHLEITREARKMTRLAVAWSMWEMCADAETEIFTRRGWLSWDQVTGEDQALGINPVTGLAEWQQVERVSRFFGQREVVVREYRGHSSVTTRNHSWLVKDSRGRWKWRTSDTMRRHDRVPRSAVLADLPRQPKYSDAFVELVAWTCAGGRLERGGSIRIGHPARSGPEAADRIRAALHALLGPPRARGGACRSCGGARPDSQGRVIRGLCRRCYERERRNGRPGQRAACETWAESAGKRDGAAFFSLSRPVSREILASCPGRVPSHDFLLSLTRAQLELFIEVSCLAAGRQAPRGCWADQDTGPRLEAFIYACVLAGKPVSAPRLRERSEPGRPPRARVRVGGRRFTAPEMAARAAPGAKRIADHAGIVWCPTVRHGNWLARRSGTMYYTGNTSLYPHCDDVDAITGDDLEEWNGAWRLGWERKGTPAPPFPVKQDRKGIRDKLQWFDAFLGYSAVTMQAMEPHIPEHVHRAVLQGGFEAGEWKYMERDWSDDAVIRFGMHGQLNRRKEPMVTLQAFSELCHEHPEFREGARLLLHTSSPGSGVFPEMNEIFERSGIGVRVYAETWDKPTLEQFYQACHALVYPSHGEGKNLPALEHAATGGAELVTDWSGHQEWLSPDYAYPLACTVEPMFPGSPRLAHWAVVDIAEVKRAMWHVFTHRAEAKAKGELASRVIPQMCSWDAVTERLFRRLRDLVPGPGEVVHGLAMACRRDEPGKVPDGLFRG